MKNQVQNQDALIEKLEKDLLSVNALPSAYRTGGDGAASSSTCSTMIQHEFLLKDVTQRSSALLQEVPQTSHGGQTTSHGDSDPSQRKTAQIYELECARQDHAQHGQVHFKVSS